MVDRNKLDHLIDRASTGRSNWTSAHVDAAAIARETRVQHAMEVLMQLGHDQLAHELRRLEKQPRPRIVSDSAELPPAA